MRSRLHTILFMEKDPVSDVKNGKNTMFTYCSHDVYRKFTLRPLTAMVWKLSAIREEAMPQNDRGKRRNRTAGRDGNGISGDADFLIFYGIVIELLNNG